MSNIKVSFSGLTTAQADVRSTAGRIETQLEDLRRFIAPMAATWEGEAAVLYLDRQRKWDAAADDLAAVLTQIGAALGIAADNYRQTEMTNAARWR